MRTKLSGATILMLVVGAAVSVAVRNGLLPRLFEPRMKTFTSAEGGFTVRMPGDPKHTTQPVPSPAGAMTMHTFEADADNGACVVSYADLPQEPADLKNFFDATRDGVVKGVNGRLVAEKDIFVSGRPGREIAIDAPAPGGTGTLRMIDKVFVAKNRMFQVMLGMELGAKLTPKQQEFLDSFALLKP
jgi:hypothetical protein